MSRSMLHVATRISVIDIYRSVEKVIHVLYLLYIHVSLSRSAVAHILIMDPEQTCQLKLWPPATNTRI